MTPRPSITAIALAGALAAGCGDPPRDPTSVAPSFHRDGDGRRTIVVDQDGRGTAKTIQEGINMAPVGGRVLVLPGTYTEGLVVNKGLTLQGIGREHDDDDDHGRHERGASGGVIIAPPGAPTIAVQIATAEPVTVRDVTIQYSGAHGIRGDGVVDLTVERVTVRAINPPLGQGRVIGVLNDATVSGGRAHLVVRESFLDGGVPPANSPTPAFPQMAGIIAQGDIDALLAGNTIRRTGAACIAIQTRPDFGGETNADIIENDLDECHPLQRGGPLNVNPPAIAMGAATATGVVNIIGNTIRNTSGSCLVTTAIAHIFAQARIERNRILSVVQPCATPTATRNPGAIWIGSLNPITPGVSSVVRFNDIEGNAHAGLRVAPNITTPIDASCNYWGSATGTTSSAWPPGTGDAVVVEDGGATPMFTPFAKRPIARFGGRHSDHDGDDDDGRRGDCGFGWSEPVNLGDAINTAASEVNPSLSPDELSLYFASNRTGGQGLNDLYVSRRASLRSPWGTPQNLGTLINTSAAEGGASVSSDGHLLFFQSGRPGGHGLNDIYVSYRADLKDDLAWEAPVNLGPHVNSAMDEAGSEYVADAHDGMASLYFNRSAAPLAGQYDIFSVPITANGLPRDPAAPIPELNLPAPVSEFGPEVSTDRRELFLSSGRPGTLGMLDLWVSTRRSVHDLWSTPESLGTPINTAFTDRQPSLSADGRTLIWSSTRTGGFGSDDLWMSTRTGGRSGDRRDDRRHR
jgi:hypothetical protein